jgi:hypothetical protein
MHTDRKGAEVAVDGGALKSTAKISVRFLLLVQTIILEAS